MPDANETIKPRKAVRGMQPTLHAPTPTASLAHRRVGPLSSCSALAHAVFHVEPAVVSGEALGFHFLAAFPEPGLVGTPLRLDVSQLLGGQFDPGRLGLRRTGLRRSRLE